MKTYSKVSLALLVFLSYLNFIWGVRPFVTDDARIVDKGQLEIETWSEFSRSAPTAPFTIGQHLMLGITFTPWFELISGSGMGREPNGEMTYANPVIQPKLLIIRAEEDGVPGLSFSFGITLPYGGGEYFDEATGYYTLALFTSRLFRDWLMIHLNLGSRGAKEPRKAAVNKFYYGIGFDIGFLVQELRYILEAFSGDPFDALGPNFSFQVGFRWLKSDYLNFDLTFGAQPAEGDLINSQRKVWESWGQLGIRYLYDWFTDGGKPGDPLGAKGLWIRPKYRQ